MDWTHFDVEQFSMGVDVEMKHVLVDLHTKVTNVAAPTTDKIALVTHDESPD